MGLGVIDGQLDRGDLLGLFVRDLDAELVFERHHQFHGVEGVGAQVSHESLFVGHFRFGNAQLLGNDLFDACRIFVKVNSINKNFAGRFVAKCFYNFQGC